MEPLIREHFPNAVIKPVENGIISRPDLTAAEVRQCSTANVESRA
jgi:hypothetical protein